MTSHPRLVALDLLLREHRIRYTSESELQDGIERLLTLHGEKLRKEAKLSEKDRVDFLTDDGIAIEVKIHGPVNEVARQLLRYAESPDVKMILLVTTRAQHRRLPAVMLGKEVYVHALGGWL